MKASHERIEALMDVSQEVMKAYPEIMEVNPKEIKSVAMHEEVPKEDARGICFGALRKRHRDRNLAVGHREKPKERTKGKGGSRKKLAAARRGMTRRA
jgi:hypothetical protein